MTSTLVTTYISWGIGVSTDVTVQEWQLRVVQSDLICVKKNTIADGQGGSPSHWAMLPYGAIMIAHYWLHMESSEHINVSLCFEARQDDP